MGNKKFYFDIESNVDIEDDRVIKKNLFGKSTKKKYTSVQSEIISKNLAEHVHELSTVLEELPTTTDNFQLNEIKIGLSITAKGGFALVSTLEAGATGSIILTFKKHN